MIAHDRAGPAPDPRRHPDRSRAAIEEGSPMERFQQGPGPAPAASTIVFVDPDMERMRDLARALQGYVVLIVGSAREAIQAVAARRVHVLVTELDLPDLSGIELLGRIHTAPMTRDVLLMVVTRRTAITSKVSAFQAGADDYLVKPVAPEAFVLHLRRLLRFRKVIGG